MQRIILIAAGFCGMASYSVITVLITSNSMRPHLLLFFWLQKQYMLHIEIYEIRTMNLVKFINDNSEV